MCVNTVGPTLKLIERTPAVQIRRQREESHTLCRGRRRLNGTYPPNHNERERERLRQAHCELPPLAVLSDVQSRLHAPRAQRRTYSTCDSGNLLERRPTYNPNQRIRRLEPKSCLSLASAAEGPSKPPVGAGPERKSTSTRPTLPSPNST